MKCPTLFSLLQMTFSLNVLKAGGPAGSFPFLTPTNLLATMVHGMESYTEPFSIIYFKAP